MSMNAFYQKSSLKCLGSILRLYTDKISFSTKHILMVLWYGVGGPYAVVQPEELQEATQLKVVLQLM